MERFELKGKEFIPLVALMKMVGWAATGGEAGIKVNDGLVAVNEALELRKRRKLKPGDIVEFQGARILIA